MCVDVARNAMSMRCVVCAVGVNASFELPNPKRLREAFYADKAAGERDRCVSKTSRCASHGTCANLRISRDFHQPNCVSSRWSLASQHSLTGDRYLAHRKRSPLHNSPEKYNLTASFGATCVLYCKSHRLADSPASNGPARASGLGYDWALFVSCLFGRFRSQIFL